MKCRLFCLSLVLLTACALMTTVVWAQANKLVMTTYKPLILHALYESGSLSSCYNNECSCRWKLLTLPALKRAVSAPDFGAARMLAFCLEADIRKEVSAVSDNRSRTADN